MMIQQSQVINVLIVTVATYWVSYIAIVNFRRQRFGFAEVYSKRLRYGFFRITPDPRLL
jgi:hypothetical protein